MEKVFAVLSDVAVVAGIPIVPDERAPSAVRVNLQTPVTLELSLKHYMPVETLSYLPNVEKVNSHTIRYIGEDMIDISKFLRVATGYRVDLQP